MNVFLLLHVRHAIVYISQWRLSCFRLPNFSRNVNDDAYLRQAIHHRKLDSDLERETTEVVDQCRR